ncbi:hypothetical protein BHS06_34915 [Myxococcus xanthus]|nr:hypothetical protein BHS06_34915 [Myxococcus xanthus]
MNPQARGRPSLGLESFKAQLLLCEEPDEFAAGFPPVELFPLLLLPPLGLLPDCRGLLGFIWLERLSCDALCAGLLGFLELARWSFWFLPLSLLMDLPRESPSESAGEA